MTRSNASKVWLITAATCLAVSLWLLGGGVAADDAGETVDAPPADERAQELIDTLSGATLVGSFNVTGDDSLDLREERYTITDVQQRGDHLFLFRFRMQYGDRDVEVAAPLVVIWAGDTPVITLTNASLPGLGRYTARVMIYADHYAGYWAAGDEIEGTMFGTIEPAE